MTDAKILAFAGSARQDSYNNKLVKIAIGVLVLPDQKAIGSAYQAFDENDNLKDESQQTAIAQLGSQLATVTAKLNI